MDFDYGYNGYAAPPNYVPWLHIELRELGKHTGTAKTQTLRFQVAAVTARNTNGMRAPIYNHKNKNLQLVFRALTVDIVPA